MKKKRWDKQGEDFLRDNPHLTNQEAGDHLGRTAMSVSKKKSRMGIGEDKRRWTEEEDYYLEISWGRVKYAIMVKKLGRSKNGIKRRAAILGLGTRYNGDGYYLTTGDVSMILGVHPAAVRQRVLKGYIKSKFFGVRRIAQISPKDMLEYLENYISVLDERKIDWELVKMYYIQDRNCGLRLSVEEIKIRICGIGENINDEKNESELFLNCI